MKRFWIKLVASLPLTDTAILIEDGKAAIKRGKVRAVLLSELSELSRTNQIEIACILASTTATTFRLSFLGVPGCLRQRYLNVWNVNWK
jgi:hypothetical protein